MPNKVVSSSTIKTIVNSGRAITLKYATETKSWKRIYLSPDVQENFSKAMEKTNVPNGATTAIMT